MENLQLFSELKADKYQWLKYEQLPFGYLWLVLRLFRDEYVVHVYNLEDDGHYYGVYCRQDRTKAEQVYQNKLAYYRGEASGSRIPHNLMEVLNQIRLTGLCNMADMIAVTEVLETYNYDHIARYILDHPENYYDLLEELGEYVRANQPESLAQLLASQMGWFVIVD
jgi:hypothetical protein